MSLSKTSWSLSFRTLARCPPLRAHSISACAQGRRAPSTAAMQNWRRATHPNPQPPTTSSTGSARYVILNPRAAPPALRTETRSVTRFSRDTVSMRRSASPGRVQCDQVFGPSWRMVRRPSHESSGMLTSGNATPVSGVPAGKNYDYALSGAAPGELEVKVNRR